MSASTWAPARQMTEDPADIRPAVAIPMAGRATAVGRRRRGGVTARERFSTARRPALRLVPPLSEDVDWPARTAEIAGESAAEATRPTQRMLDGRDTRVGTDAPVGTDARPTDSPAATPSIPRQPFHALPVVARLPIGSENSSARARPAHAPVRLTRRGRLVLAAVLLVFAAAMVVVLASNVQASPPSRPPHAVVVHPGDTLWSIAARVHPQGSLTDTMLAIERLNHMPDGTVYVGQQLLVPNS